MLSRSLDGDLVQRAALDVLHREEDAAGVFADFVHRADVGMPQALKDAALELQPIAPLGVVRRVRRQHLQRDQPCLREVARQIHVAHPAVTEDLLDDVAADCGAWMQWRAGSLTS